MAQAIKGLAELNILNKELKQLDTEYFEVSKRFDNAFRVYMNKFGKTRLKKYDIDTFNKITQQRKKVDHVANLNAELGSSFLKFTTSNLLKIKSEEVKFYEVVKKAKRRALQHADNNDQEKPADDPEAESQPDSSAKTNRFDKLRLQQSPRASQNRLSENKMKQFESPLSNKFSLEQQVKDNTLQMKEIMQKSQTENHLPIRESPSSKKAENKPMVASINHHQISRDKYIESPKAVVERIQIERGSYSEDESDD